tara:strand:- start:68 stop:1102 length:1035 start_codon:yes stop_codon:yes gene_type:complete
MRILVVGNMGYVGSVLVPYLRKVYPKSSIVGLDIGYFSEKIIDQSNPEDNLDDQIILDLREITQSYLIGFDVVINLAAISNDPMGKEFEIATEEINFLAGIKLAKLSKEADVKKFIFASSCSVYGEGLDNSKSELDKVNPLTEYAKSKINTEIELSKLATSNFLIKSLRFSTACGFSPRLRLDIVLNDFVASSLKKKEINILSDGNPWRPLIHVEDMARAIHWSIEDSNKEVYQVLNVGSLEGNYQVKDLAEAIKKIIPDTKININKDASPDKRTYKVDFSSFNHLAKGFQPIFSLEDSVNDLIKNIKLYKLDRKNIKSSEFIRLKALKESIRNNLIDSRLKKI